MRSLLLILAVVALAGCTSTGASTGGVSSPGAGAPPYAGSSGDQSYRGYYNTYEYVKHQNSHRRH